MIKKKEQVEHFSIEPMIGYREWSVKTKIGKRYVLVGAGYGSDYEYKPSINVAVCINKNHKDVPEAECECGFYAYKYRVDMLQSLLSLDSVVIFASCNYSVSSNSENIWGVVEFTGKVIEHTEGYRAQYCEIKKLIYKNIDKKILKFLQDYYQVPIIFYKDYLEKELFK